MAELRDDGTMDTVIGCEKCGEEMRFTFQDDHDHPGKRRSYNDFVKECIKEFDEEHECPEEDDTETGDDFDIAMADAEEVNDLSEDYPGQHIDGPEEVDE